MVSFQSESHRGVPVIFLKTNGSHSLPTRETQPRSAYWPPLDELAARRVANVKSTAPVLFLRYLRVGGRDAPDRIADVVGDQQRAGLVDRDADRAAARLAVGVEEAGDDVLGLAARMAVR